MEQYQILGKRYLQSNACGTMDGSMKAKTHEALSILFVSERLGLSANEASMIEYDHDRLVNHVREATRTLTDNLDEMIGLPLDKAPNYKRLTPIFVGKFIQLATDWFDEQTCLMSDTELTATLEEICRYKHSMMLTALESYGFEFRDGIVEEFLTMESKIGQVVTVKPNNYFGCNFELVKSLTKRGE